MRVLFAAIPAYGHLYPMLPLAQAFVDADHEVVVATADPFVHALPFPTIRTLDGGLDLDAVIAETRRRHPGIAGFDLSRAFFADTIADLASAALVPAMAATPPDLVVFDAMNVGAGVAASVLGVPAVAFSVGLAHHAAPQIHDATLGYVAHAWTDRGLLPPLAGSDLARALIDPSPPTTNPPVPGDPVRRLPVRTVAYNTVDAPLPGWLSAARTRPRVYLTLGTVSFGAVEVLRRALDDLGPLDVDVLVSIGPEGDPALLGQPPANAHVERFVAQSAVLPVVDLAVHHGGTGTVLGALAAGLPQLVLPQGADHFFNSQVLDSCGAARTLLNEQQEPGAIAAAVVALLDPTASERGVADRIRAEIEAMPTPAEIVPQLCEIGAG